LEQTDQTGEVAIRLSTNSQDSIITKIINGKLDAIVLKSNQKVQVIIESELGYVIFHRHEFEGVEYIALRTRAVSQLSDSVGLQDIPNMDKFNLNEKLIITIMGPKNTQVDLILRIT